MIPKDFCDHLSKEGKNPAPNWLVGRIHQEHVVVGMPYKIPGEQKVLLYLIHNWDWLNIDPPQIFLGEHHIWEAIDQAGQAAWRMIYENNFGLTLTFNLSLRIRKKILIGERTWLEICNLGSKTKIHGKLTFNSFKHGKTLEAELKGIVSPRLHNQLMDSKNWDKLTLLVKRCLKQRGWPEEKFEFLFEKISSGNLNNRDLDLIEKIFDLYHNYLVPC